MIFCLNEKKPTEQIEHRLGRYRKWDGGNKNEVWLGC